MPDADLYQSDVDKGKWKHWAKLYFMPVLDW